MRSSGGTGSRDADRTKVQSDYAAAMLYAWALLFPDDGIARLGPLDPRTRVAADLYNRALTSAFTRTGAGVIAFEDQTGLERALPFGKISVAVRPDLLKFDGHEFYDLRPVTELQVRGLRNRYRHPGIGSPVAARTKPLPGHEPIVRLSSTELVPLTVVVAIERPVEGLRSGRFHATLEIFASLDALSFENSDGLVIALESEPSAALAASLYQSAHIEGVASERIVESPHSGMQAASKTIEEVRRILLEHSAASDCPVPQAVALSTSN